MNHNFMFAGQKINLDQPESDVLSEMQAAIDKYDPSPNKHVRVLSYKETRAKTFEMVIERQYASNAGVALGNGFICDRDESLLTGLSIDVFQPFKPGKAMVAPLIPWYDDVVYTSDDSFCGLWKQMNQKMANETIREISVIPSQCDIHLTVKFAKDKPVATNQTI